MKSTKIRLPGATANDGHPGNTHNVFNTFKANAVPHSAIYREDSNKRVKKHQVYFNIFSHRQPYTPKVYPCSNKKSTKST